MKYPKLPVMQCDEGCGECCGPATCRQCEFEAIESFIADKEITPIVQGLKCPLFQNGTCSVYSVRPMICRAFGHCEEMNCCRGYNVNIGSRQKRETIDAYMQTLCREGTRYLHELLRGGLEYLVNELQNKSDDSTHQRFSK